MEHPLSDEGIVEHFESLYQNNLLQYNKILALLHNTLDECEANVQLVENAIKNDSDIKDGMQQELNILIDKIDTAKERVEELEEERKDLEEVLEGRTNCEAELDQVLEQKTQEAKSIETYIALAYYAYHKVRSSDKRVKKKIDAIKAWASRKKTATQARKNICRMMRAEIRDTIRTYLINVARIVRIHAEKDQEKTQVLAEHDEIVLKTADTQKRIETIAEEKEKCEYALTVVEQEITEGNLSVAKLKKEIEDLEKEIANAQMQLDDAKESQQLLHRTEAEHSCKEMVKVKSEELQLKRTEKCNQFAACNRLVMEREEIAAEFDLNARDHMEIVKNFLLNGNGVPDRRTTISKAKRLVSKLKRKLNKLNAQKNKSSELIQSISKGIQAQKDENVKLNEELEAAKKKCITLNQDIAHLREQLDSVTSKEDNRKQMIDDLINEENYIKKTIAELEAEEEKMKFEYNAKVQEQIEAQKNRLKRLKNEDCSDMAEIIDEEKKNSDILLNAALETIELEYRKEKSRIDAEHKALVLERQETFNAIIKVNTSEIERLKAAIAECGRKSKEAVEPAVTPAPPPSAPRKTNVPSEPSKFVNIILAIHRFRIPGPQENNVQFKRHNVGVQTRFDVSGVDVTMESVRRDLYRFITGCNKGGGDAEYEVQLSAESLEPYTDSGNMQLLPSKQTSYLPNDPVTCLCIKNENTYAVAMLYNEGGARYIESTIPSVRMMCLGGISKLAFAQNDNVLLFGGSHCGSIHAWDTTTYLEVASMPPSASKGHLDPIAALELLDDDTLLSVDISGKAFKWSLRNLSEPVARFDWSGLAPSSRISAVCRGSTFYCAMLNGWLYDCNLDGTSSRSCAIHDSAVTSAALSNIYERELLATSAFDCSVKVWDCKTIRETFPSGACWRTESLAFGQENDNIKPVSAVPPPSDGVEATSSENILHKDSVPDSDDVSREIATNPYFKIPKYDRKLRELAVLHPDVMEKLGVYVIPVKAAIRNVDGKLSEKPVEGEKNQTENEADKSNAATAMQYNLAYIIKQSEMIMAMTPEEKLQFIPRLKDTIVYEIMKNNYTFMHILRAFRSYVPRQGAAEVCQIERTVLPFSRRHISSDDTDERFRHVSGALPRTDRTYDKPQVVVTAIPPAKPSAEPSSKKNTKLDSAAIKSIPLEIIEDALLKFVPENIKSINIGNEPLTPGQAFYLENRDKLLENLRRRYFEETGAGPSDGEIESLLPQLMEEEPFGSYDPDPVVSPGKHHLWDYDTTTLSSTSKTIHLRKGEMPTLQQVVDILEQERISNVSVVDMDSCNRRDQAMYCIVGTGATRAHCRRVGRMLYRAIVDLDVPFVSDTAYCCHSRSDEWIVARLGPLCVHLMVNEVRQNQSIEDLWAESRAEDAHRLSEQLPEPQVSPVDSNISITQ
ncbi:uncharacterized protein BXIN_1434 [Babesia sp. Xinjiang]|uniref:uncharacterized protein n=1 Tax=Babesia sp. Xinjiang TaxID=462227 RepID=UPI000A22913D|nr:uncharacterized protein BXIN_1434 [Babesia sp. Xinjiang]ORM39935.1 hypothetical protein BXIN_1434 [Babesia sp. Xinjiang]